LLGDAASDGVEARSRAAGEHNSFHEKSTNKAPLVVSIIAKELLVVMWQ
jgi:hypothetical protein